MSKHRNLNAEINLWSAEGKLQLEKDKEAAREYFVGEDGINTKMRFFHDLEEKTDFLITNGYWDDKVVLRFGFDHLKALMKYAYSFKFRFATLMGAEKFYGQYAMKDITGKQFLERYEDRVVLTALAYADDEDHSYDIVREIIEGRFQPATPTFLNSGRKRAGAPVSCFLLRIEDNMESIGRSINSALQLSKRGGGVALQLTNIRESGAPIKEMENQSSGIVPIMKLLEDSFSYANQLGARQGAGAVYLNAHHPDIMKFLDTKRENADEKIRIKTLSLGVVIPDVTFELARKNEDMYLFSPYDIERVYGKAFSDFSVTEHYDEWVEDSRIRKTKVSARKFFQTVAELQFESGYPYIMFEDTANEWNPAPNVGRITMSNLCVAPETRVLTDEGYKEIQTIADTYVNAWNGESFSRSYVTKTGQNQELIRVNFSNGASLDVTPYHKFYVKTGYGNSKVIETPAGELQPGDKLDKFELAPVTSGDEVIPYAYTAGLFTSEGTYYKNGTPVLRLYDKKKALLPYVDHNTASPKEDGIGRINLTLPKDILPKFAVPTDASLQSRLEWLAGVIDGDGYGNGVVGIQIASIHPEYLEELRVLLTTLGVHSKWAKLRDAGMMDFNDGYGPYPTKDVYRLVISGVEAQKLRKLGLPTKRVIIEPYEHQRAAREFVKVESVVATGRISDTYCLNEPVHHKVVFEGIQTGNCSEIAQPQTPSTFNEDLSYQEIGQDISCNLGSLNVAKMAALENMSDFSHSVETAYKFLSNVAESTEIVSVPSVRKGNLASYAIGLGQMNLHGYFIEQGIDYASEEALDFWRSYISDVTYCIISASNQRSIERDDTFVGFEGSRWQSGEQIEHMLDKGGVQSRFGIQLSHWNTLKQMVSKYGLYNRHLQAIPPTGSISYINNSTSSIHPVTSKIEIRKEGQTGRIYYPAYGLTNENHESVKSAYEYGPEAVIDMYAASAPFIDQGQSLTLFFRDTATTRDINKAQIYAWRKGVKSLYYIRLLQEALKGTEVEGCVSCAL